MKKLFFSLIFIAAIVLLGAYYVTGIKAESHLKALVEDANTAPNVTVTLSDYNRGWFSSDAVLNVHVVRLDQATVKTTAMAKSLLQPIDFKTHINVTHGPLMFAKGAPLLGLAYTYVDIPLPQSMTEEFDKTFTKASQKPRVAVTVSLAYDKSSEINFDIPTFKLIPKDGKGQVDWRGLHSHWTISSNMTDIQGGIDVKGMVADVSPFQVSLGSIKLAYDVSENVDKLWSGKVLFDFPSLEVNVDGQKTLVISGFHFDSDSAISKNVLNSALKAKLDGIVVDGTNYGPGEFSMGLNNFNATVFAKISQQLQAANQVGVSQQQRQMMVMGILPELPKLLNKGANIDLQQLKFTLPQGVVDLSAKVGVPADTVVSNIMALFTQVRADANVQLPAKLVREVLGEMFTKQLKQNQMLQQALIKQMEMKKAQAEKLKQSAENASADAEVAKASDSDEATAAPKANESAKLMTNTEIEQQATAQVERQINKLLKSGALIQQGDAFQIKLVFKSGQLFVNDKPFTQDMIK